MPLIQTTLRNCRPRGFQWIALKPASGSMSTSETALKSANQVQLLCMDDVYPKDDRSKCEDC